MKSSLRRELEFLDAGERDAMDAPEHNRCQLLGKQCMAPGMSLRMRIRKYLQHPPVNPNHLC